MKPFLSTLAAVVCAGMLLSWLFPRSQDYGEVIVIIDTNQPTQQETEHQIGQCVTDSQCNNGEACANNQCQQAVTEPISQPTSLPPVCLWNPYTGKAKMVIHGDRYCGPPADPNIYPTSVPTLPIPSNVPAAGELMFYCDERWSECKLIDDDQYKYIAWNYRTDVGTQKAYWMAIESPVVHYQEKDLDSKKCNSEKRGICVTRRADGSLDISAKDTKYDEHGFENVCGSKNKKGKISYRVCDYALTNLP